MPHAKDDDELLREAAAHPAYADPWAGVSAETLKRDQLQIETNARMETERRNRRHETAMHVWSGVGYVMAGLIVAAVALGIVYAIWSSNKVNNEKRLLREQEQTKQVQACTSLQEPAERQLCIINLTRVGQ